MNEKTILFLGSVNSMPMMYASILKGKGYDVEYLVCDSNPKSIDRPENIFSSISYPYPSWIKESSVIHKFLIPLFPLYYYLKLKLFVLDRKNPDLIFLNDTFVSLGRFFPRARKIFLTHGGDLDSWANLESVKKISEEFSRKQKLRFVPYFFIELIIGRIVKRMFQGASTCQEVLYFPLSFDKEGEKVVRRLESQGVDYIPRFDISFETVEALIREQQESSKLEFEKEKLIIVSAVRFAFKSFPQGNVNYNKGNDHILRGVGEAVRNGVNLELHLFNKGVDLNYAIELIDELGLGEFVIWHDELPLVELLKLYEKADICFDSVGQHWLGAVGCYALYMGKPLIADVDDLVRAGVIPESNPIFQASNASDVCNNILHIAENGFCEYDGVEFSRKYFTPDRVLKKLGLI